MSPLIERRKRVALYVRVSTEEQGEHGLSVDAQLQALREYCKKNGYEIYDEYVDEGVSAGALKKRKQLQRLLQDCRDGKIDLILFTKLDRWFRHVSKYHVIQEELNKLEIPWLAINEPLYETMTATGRTIINLYLSMAQGEVERTSERVKHVMQYKVSQGHALTGSLPLGYNIGPDKKPVLDPDVAPIALFILTEYEKYQSMGRVAEEARKRFKVDVSYTVVRKTLKNKRYTGYFRGNPDYFPKLISMGQYERNQELIKRNLTNRPTKDGEQRIYLFVGLLRCKDCGWKMSGCRTGNGYKTYECPKHRQKGPCPHNKTLSEGKIEKLLLERVQKDISDLRIQAEKRALEKKAEPEYDLDDLKEQQKRLNALFLKGRITEVEYDEEYELLEAQISKAILSMGENGAPRPGTELVLSPDFEDIYKEFTDEEKRLFWRDILNYVVVRGYDFEPHFLV